MGGSFLGVALAPQIISVESGHLFLIFYCLFIFEREREREKQSVSGRGADREGDTESKAGSRLRAFSTEPNAGLKLRNCEIMT